MALVVGEGRAALTIEATVLTSADNALCDAAERLGLHVANPLES